MVRIIDESIEGFWKRTKEKKLYVWGAGNRLELVYDGFGLENRIEGIIDSKAGSVTWKTIKNEKIPMIQVQDFVRYVELIGKESIALLISVRFQLSSIVSQLDSIEKLNDIECYLAVLMEEKYEAQQFTFTEGRQLIPKVIHYCWFGKKAVPPKLKSNIDGWKKICPDYEIIRWDESNYDVYKNRYISEAYECGKWGFVADFARLEIVYKEGGIYLDTDVELLTTLDPLLCDEMYCGFATGIQINLGSGVGAVPNHFLLREMLEVYKDKTFLDSNGKMNLTTCALYQHPVLMNYGFEMKNIYQKRENVVLYPSEVLSPYSPTGLQENITANTISVHRYAKDWYPAKEVEGVLWLKKICRDRLHKADVM